MAGLFTVAVLTIGLLKVCCKTKYLTAHPPSYFANDAEEEEGDSAFDVYIEKDK